MKAITIRGVDKNLEKKIKNAAKSESVSINQFILNSLRKSLGLDKDNIHTKEYDDLNFLFGQWSDDDYDSFEKSQKEFQSVDTDLWQ